MLKGAANKTRSAVSLPESASFESLALEVPDPYTSTRMVAEILLIAIYYHSSQNHNGKGQRDRIDELADHALKVLLLENTTEENRIKMLIGSLQEAIADIHNKPPKSPFENKAAQTVSGWALTVFGTVHDYGKNSTLGRTLLVLRSDAVRQLGEPIKNHPMVKDFDREFTTGKSRLSNITYHNGDQIPKEVYKNSNTASERMAALVIINYMVHVTSNFLMAYAQTTKKRITATDPNKLKAYRDLKTALLKLAPTKKDQNGNAVMEAGQCQLDPDYITVPFNLSALLLETIEKLKQLIAEHVTENKALQSLASGDLKTCAETAINYLTYVSTPPDIAYAKPAVHYPKIVLPDDGAPDDVRRIRLPIEEYEAELVSDNSLKN